MPYLNKELAHGIATNVVDSFLRIDSIRTRKHDDFWSANGCRDCIETMESEDHQMSDNGRNGYAGKFSVVLNWLWENETKFVDVVLQLIYTCNQMERALLNAGEFESADYIYVIKRKLWESRHSALELY